MLVTLFLGALIVGLAAVVTMRRGSAGHLAAHERKELAERCIAIGVPKDEVEAMVARFDDKGLIERHRLEHRRLKSRTGPFR